MHFSLVSKYIEQLLDVMDHVENVGIEETVEIISKFNTVKSGRQEETSVAKDSHEVVNNFLLAEI
jgi:hypothetical protein